MSTELLEIRRTRRYVGTYRHLDRWDRVGTLRRVQTHVRDIDPEDPCEPLEHQHIVCVEADRGVPSDQIEAALRDHYSSAGCAHEWDCCGCRSFYAESVTRLDRSRYAVRVLSSRNF